MRRSLLALFMAALLLSCPCMAFADGNPPEYIDGGELSPENDDGYAIGNTVLPEDAPEYIDNAEAFPESGDEYAGGDTALPEENTQGPEVIDGAEAFSEADLYIGGYSVLTEENTPEVICSEGELRTWFASHPNGGSISLGADITVTSLTTLYSPVSIDTGAFGITLSGGTIWAEPLSITGEGVRTPVLTVENMGRFITWDYTLASYNVTARGQDGIGGTAVRVSTNSDGSADSLEYRGHIRSVGNAAVGVLFDYPDKAHKANFLSISVEGENSVAVKATRGASLYYGRLEASGTGARIASGGDILLDACKITGDASGAEVVNRKIVALAGSWLYWPLLQGQAMRGSGLYSTFGFASLIPFLLSGDENHPAEVRRLYCLWDKNALDNINTSVIGRTVVSGGLLEDYQGFGLEDEFSLDLTVDVQDGTRPCIISPNFGTEPDTGRRYVYFNTCDLEGLDFEPEYGNFILWRSDDEGISWHDVTDSPDVSPASGGVTYYFDEITNPVWFRIQEVGGGYSNIAVIYGYEGNTYGSHGGDRTGVDRDGDSTDSRLTSEPQPVYRHNTQPSSGTPSIALLPVLKLPVLTEAVEAFAPDGYDEQPPQELFDPQPPAVDDAIAGRSAANTESPAASTESPPPERSPSPPKPAPELPREWEDTTTTAISGKRLLLLMDSGDTVTFIKDEVRLSIDASALEALNIDDGQLFTLTVERLDSRRYTVSAGLDGVTLYGLPCVATLDGRDYSIYISGDFDTEAPNEPVQAQIPPPAAAGPPSETKTPDNFAVEEKPAVDKAEEQPAHSNMAEESPSAWPAAVLAVLGIAGAFGGTAAFLKFRVSL